MVFTNTVDIVGDAALTRSIVDRTITELNDNISTSIRQQAFRVCSALASVNFPSVTQVALGAFWRCTALAKAEFSASVAFANNAFYGCTALTALILRSTEQICTITGTPFAASAIASGTGYIYVPAALVDQYKASWTGNAAQIRAIEDYPEVCDPYSWAAVAKTISNGTYKDVYKVGDLVPLTTTYNMQIVAFDTDDLADGSGKAPITWVVEKSNKLIGMNPNLTKVDDVYQEGTGTIGGWEKCRMRANLPDYCSYIPDDVRSMIKTVRKYSNGYDASGAKIMNSITEDDIWLLSAQEVYGGTDYETSGSWYEEMFPDNNSRKKALSNWYWLRTAKHTDAFYAVKSSTGEINSNATNGNLYMIFGFCT